MKYDAIIIGGGPAGCSCALWMYNMGFNPVIIEKETMLGGLQATSPFPNIWMAGVPELTGIQFARNLQSHIEDTGIKVLFQSEIISAKITHPFIFQVKSRDNIETLESDYLVIATGVEPISNGITRTNNVLIGPGNHILEYDYTDKDVAILGGGDNAMENYNFIASRRPHKVRIYARHIRARKSMIKLVPGDFLYEGEYQADQNKMEVSIRGRKEKFDVFLVMYGWQAVIPDFLLPIREKLADARGFIITDKDRQTKIPQIYAIGEVTFAVHPSVITAMSDGIICAKSIQYKLDNHQR